MGLLYTLEVDEQSSQIQVERTIVKVKQCFNSKDFAYTSVSFVALLGEFRGEFSGVFSASVVVLDRVESSRNAGVVGKTSADSVSSSSSWL